MGLRWRQVAIGIYVHYPGDYKVISLFYVIRTKRGKRELKIRALHQEIVVFFLFNEIRIKERN